MNKEKIQLEVCKAMLNPEARVYGFDINENEFAVTTDGYKCFVFSNSEIIFDKNKIVYRDFSAIFKDNEKDVVLERTKKMYKINGKTIIEYKCGEKSVFADAQQAKEFSDFNLYTNNSLNRVIAKDYFGKIVGIFMPMRVTENEL